MLMLFQIYHFAAFKLLEDAVTPKSSARKTPRLLQHSSCKALFIPILNPIFNLVSIGEFYSLDTPRHLPVDPNFDVSSLAIGTPARAGLATPMVTSLTVIKTDLLS